MLAERVAQICNGKLDNLEASHSGSVSLGKSPSFDSVPGPSNQDLREIPIDHPIMANPWRSYETTFWWEDTKELELVSGARLPADTIEFRDPCAYSNTEWRSKTLRERPPQREVLSFQPRVLGKAQLELLAAHKGGFTSKALDPQGSSSGKNTLLFNWTLPMRLS